MKISGLKPFIVPIFIPHRGCPHRCIFCNQNSIIGPNQPLPTPETIRDQIYEFLAYRKSSHTYTQIAFYGGNFLGLPHSEIEAFLSEASQIVAAGDVDGIRFSTRPDTVCSSTLNLIKKYPIKTIELGVQSMEDNVLARSHRGHTAADAIQAVARLQAHSYQIGIQMMLGLPGEHKRSAETTARKIAALKPDFVRIYPTVVLANSPLAQLYKNGIYQPVTLAEAVNMAKQALVIFTSHAIPVVRIGLQSSTEPDATNQVLAGPYHPAFGHMVYSEWYLDTIGEMLNSVEYKPLNIILKVHSANESKVRGLKNANIGAIIARTGCASVSVKADTRMRTNVIELWDSHHCLVSAKIPATAMLMEKHHHVHQ